LIKPVQHCFLQRYRFKIDFHVKFAAGFEVNAFDTCYFKAVFVHELLAVANR